MTSTAPREAPVATYSADVDSTSARSDLGAVRHRSVRAPVIGALAAASVFGSLLNTTNVTPASTNALGVVKLHGQIRRHATSTGTADVEDLRSFITGTSFVTINYDNLIANPFKATATRMSELQSLAPGLSLRHWAELFGVSKETIRNWSGQEPPSRPELDAAVRALRTVETRQADVGLWLQSELPGSTITPLQIAQAGRWRALGAAARMIAPVGLGVTPTQEMREMARERRLLSKRLGGADAMPAEDVED